MNNNILKGNWKEVKGSVKEKWGKLTDNHLTEIDGKKRSVSRTYSEAIWSI